MNPPVVHSHKANKLPPHFFNGNYALQGFSPLSSSLVKNFNGLDENALGADLSQQNQELNQFLEMQNSSWYRFWHIAAIVSAGACAYHGYKRKESVGWAIGWCLLGGMFPVITPAIALAQGFGKKKD